MLASNNVTRQLLIIFTGSPSDETEEFKYFTPGVYRNKLFSDKEVKSITAAL